MARKGLFPASIKAGVPKISNIPKDWSLVPFGEVVRIVERPAELKDDEEYQLVTAKRSRGGIIPRERLLGKEILTKTQFYTNAGDFLISRRQIIHGACGLVPQSLDGAIVSNEYSTLLTKPNLLKEYFTYFSHTTYFQQTCFQSSVGVDIEKMIFKIDDWLKYKFPLPPLLEQRKIAEILSSVDRSIALTQAVVTQTRKVKQALLQQLLTRGIGHTKFKETAIGRIPESWTFGRVGDFFELQRGFDITQKQVVPGNIPVISSSGISYYHNQATAQPPGVLTGRKGKLGQAIFVSEPYWAHDTTLWVKNFKGNFPKFIFWFLLKLNLEKLDAATACPTLNRNVVHSLLVPFPPMYEQEKIAGRLDEIEEFLVSSKEEIDKLQHLKHGVMQNLLTGRIRANVSA